ncbi:MAG TPA: cache domain-containing protein [Herpetosiphonaceae bacterium]|nr:cache domain-containing protein [Herpetosiphonaceae bacterium]
MSTALKPGTTADPGQKVPFRHRIRWRLIAVLVGVAIIPLLISVPLTLYFTGRQTEQQVINQLESVVQLKESQLKRWLNDNLATLQLLGAGPFQPQFQNLVAGADPFAVSQLNQIFRSLTWTPQSTTKSNLRFNNVFFYTLDGEVRSAADQNQIGKIVRGQPYFEASLSQPNIQPPYYAVGANSLTLIMSFPVRDGGGDIMGVVAGELDLQVLADIMLERSGLGESGETYLVSLESNYLLTPSRFPGYPLQQTYHSEGIDAALAGQSGSEVYPSYRASETVVGVYRWLPELQAGLLAEVSLDEAFAGSGRAATISLLIALATLLGAGLVGFLMATRIARPITALTEGARRVESGDLSEQVAVRGRDEISLLAHAFNTMTDHVRQNQAELAQRVAERTVELERALGERGELLGSLQTSLQAREQLESIIRGLSIPVVPVLEGILAMPLIGELDQDRAAAMTGTILTAISSHRARVVIIDITGVPMIDTYIAQALIQTARAITMLGAHCVLVGIRPEIAETIVGLGLDLSEIATLADLQSGVRYAMHVVETRRASRRS